MSKPGIIVALDGLKSDQAAGLIDKIGDRVWGYKFNDLLHDPNILFIRRMVKDAGAKIMIDAKLHDIPNTVENTVRRMCERKELAPDFITVHASGGAEMVRAAKKPIAEMFELGDHRPQILAVTVLTSLDDEDVKTIYRKSRATKQVELFVELVCGEDMADGVVCSAKELGYLCCMVPFSPEDPCLLHALDRHLNFKVVPGIRPEWYTAENPPKDDQKRVATPASAARDGATHLVIGRPIVRADDPLDAVLRTLLELEVNETKQE